MQEHTHTNQITYFGRPVPKDLTTLPHKKRSFWERLLNWFTVSHVCQICGRKEVPSVEGWLQINHPYCQDEDGCSVICINCQRENSDIFGPPIEDL